MARPTTYKPEYVEQAAKLAQLGATDEEMAGFFKVTVRAFYKWKARYPELVQALKVGKDAADDRVERALYSRALGYSFPSEKVFCKDGIVTRAKIVEHVPPDTTAAIFWLKNRRKDEWRDKVETGLTDKDGNDVPLVGDLGSNVAFILRKALEEKQG